MTTTPTDTRYNYAEVEPRIYEIWRKVNAFAGAVSSDGKVRDKARAAAKPYVIVIPPPNVTGRLHMGHALNNTIQDMLTRYARMDGLDALWIPGTDHAGIATQTVVKKMLDAEGVDYRTLGREKFTEKVWEWKKKYGDMILKQLERIGSSCDWERTRFTMDEGLSKAVTHTFKKLYDEGLIYRGKRIVNWCPVDKTALSDDEVETKEGGEKGFLWQIKYKLEDGSGDLIVATTRPETLFGDVAIAVNPKDERFNKYIGQKVIVPLQERVVPVIGDEYVDMEFGTGCLKITPAHDPNDFEIGTRHNLAPINVMNEDATMNEVAPERYRGLDRNKCRELAITELKEKEILVSEEERMTPLGRSYRSGAVIEYRLSDQWFVKMRPLADKVLAKHSELNIQPDRWNKVYLSWLENIRDWCISRQIWWGHRIPAWYCSNSSSPLVGEGGRRPGEGASACPPIVSETTPTKCPHCGSTNLTQETDVLDTWFSSALWPMSTLGWPEVTPDFERYFPTSTLVTGKDIIFFWVARMNMMAVHFTGKLPYKNVYINPIVLDEKGETMSKSKGNGIDPLVLVNGASLEELKGPVMEARPANMKEIIKRLEKNFPNGYEAVGADAMRYTLMYLCSGGQQLKISLNTFQDLGRRFITKLWNAARFIFMYIEKEESPSPQWGEGGRRPGEGFSATPEDIWMQSRIKLATQKIRRCLDEFDFTNLGQHYYQIVWNDFCDWYIELCKVRLSSEDAAVRRQVQQQLVAAFSQILVLLHPLTPFITEELWARLLPLADKHQLWGNSRPESELLIRQKFVGSESLSKGEEDVVRRFDAMQDLVGACRTLRKTYQIKDSERLKAHVIAKNDDAKIVAAEMNATVVRLAGLESLTLLAANTRLTKMITVVDTRYDLLLDISSFIDVDKEKGRLEKEISRLEGAIKSLSARLNNPDFVSNADASIVAEQRQTLLEQEQKLAQNRTLLGEILAW